jgi:phosphohistidine phosphatase
MGSALSKLLSPQVIAASPARRAQATLQGLVQGWPELAGLEHRCEEDLYTFSVHELLTWITAQNDTHEALFILGHNPGLTDLVNWLCGAQVLVNLPTAAYVGLELGCDSWSGITPGCASLRHSVFPRDLDDA